MKKLLCTYIKIIIKTLYYEIQSEYSIAQNNSKIIHTVMYIYYASSYCDGFYVVTVLLSLSSLTLP